MQIRYDHYPYVLESEILHRREMNRYFLETEMWYLLYNVIRGAAKF